MANIDVVVDVMMMFNIVIFPFVLIVALLLVICLLWQIMKTQCGIAASLEAANRTYAAMLEALQDIGTVAEAGEAEEAAEAEPETPADFVYCPECSTRVEVDPGIRNLNVVCPDCKKPFHIH